MFPFTTMSTPTPNKGLKSLPIAFLDVDGVISLFGFDHTGAPPGRFHTIEGIPHCIGEACGGRIARLAPHFELVWATGWEEKANDHLRHLLGLPLLQTLRFDGLKTFGEAHWKLAALDAYAAERPAAWIDDSLDERCRRWAAERPAPTLLIETDPAVGIEERHVERLLEFAASLIR